MTVDDTWGLGLAKLQRLVINLLNSCLEAVKRLQSLLLLHLGVKSMVLDL